MFVVLRRSPTASALKLWSLLFRSVSPSLVRLSRCQRCPIFILTWALHSRSNEAKVQLVHPDRSHRATEELRRPAAGLQFIVSAKMSVCLEDLID